MKLKIFLLAMLLALAVVPALAQDASTTSVAVSGFSFNLPSTLASNVNVMQLPGDPTTLQQPGGPSVKRTVFVFYNGTTLPQNEYDGLGTINLYNTADFAGYDFVTAQFQSLQTLLSQHADLTPFMNADPNNPSNMLPFLPTANAAQVIRARAHYVDSASLTGVSYVTVYRQDVAPFTGDEFVYTFQGLSSDGTRYVAATFKLNTPVFPAQIPPNFDMNAFNQQFASYLAESVGKLNNAAPTDFSPSLNDLDSMILSFSFAGAAQPGFPTQPPPPSPTPTDASMGGLAGFNWTLVSYGDPAAPTAALPDVAVTAIFSGTGVAGNGGCNGYGGSFQFSANSLTISDLVHTEIACTPSTILDQENAYLEALSKAVSYQINGTQLLITYDGGVLTFTAS